MTRVVVSVPGLEDLVAGLLRPSPAKSSNPATGAITVGSMVRSSAAVLDGRASCSGGDLAITGIIVSALGLEDLVAGL